MLQPAEWHWLRQVAFAGPTRFKMPGPDRMLLYALAIQTGLRSDELRSLTPGRLYLQGERPYVVCMARSTKNKQDARLYVTTDLAVELQRHIRSASPAAPLFEMPSPSNVSRMFGKDLEEARTKWLNTSAGPDERRQRERGDFLARTNHNGEVADFHALRHTCGVWLSMSGVHPKVVQTVMRHSSITLTMDTYGHLFPGQDADVVAGMPSMFAPPPERLATTEADDTPDDS